MATYWNDLSIEDSRDSRPHSSTSPKLVLDVETREGTAQEALAFLLNCQITVCEGAPRNKFYKEKDTNIVICLSELPLTENSRTKFQALLLKRIGRESDALKFLIQCFNRSLSKPKPKWKEEVWSLMCAYAQETCVAVTMEQLVQVADSLPSGDLWATIAGMYSSSSIQKKFVGFLSDSSGEGILVPPQMLSAILSRAKETPSGRKAVGHLFVAATEKLPRIESPDELYMEASKAINSVSSLSENATAVEILCNLLRKEVENAASSNGQYFEKSSIFGNSLSPNVLLSASMNLKKVLGSKKYACYMQLRGFPHPTLSDVNTCHMSVRQGFNKCHDFTFSMLRKITRVKEGGKGNVLGWFAAVVSMNEKRTGPRYDQKEIFKVTTSDGFMVNLCTVLLKLMQSLYTIAPSANLAKVDPGYSSSDHCRIPFHDESCLAKGTIDTPAKSVVDQFFPTQSDFNFMTECFHITQRALHVMLLPTLTHMFQLMRARLSPEDLQTMFQALVFFSYSSHLLDPAFALPCTQFYITFCVWISMQVEECKKASSNDAELHSKLAAKLGCVPLYTFKDMERWFSFLTMFDPKFLTGLQLAPLVDCCVTLLQHSEILSDPVTQTCIASILSGFIDSDKRTQRHSVTSGWGSGIAGNLSATVHGSPMVKEHLGPALLHTYVAVDTAEGVDVDKEDFEKYGARSNILNILTGLWKRGDCRVSILRECGTSRFQSFLHSLLDMMSYFLNESLCRLRDVGKFEKLKQDSTYWESLNYSQKKQKEQFYKMDKDWAMACNRHGAKVLDFLTKMTEEPLVVKDICCQPLSGQTAASMCEFLESLCGPEASQLKVQDMDKYKFKPQEMLTNLCTILLRIWQVERAGDLLGGFLYCMASYPDYSHKAVSKAVYIISSHQLLPVKTVEELSNMLSQLERMSKECGTYIEVNVGDAWYHYVDKLSVDYQKVKEVYVEALEPLKYDGAELVGVHSYSVKARLAAPAPNSPKVRAILAEIEKLDSLLQIHPDSSIFVRQDEDHMDLVRTIITGPVDTPYSRGCFVFDIYFPERYPMVSPLVKIVTTGNSTVRFNPNLYRDGKVCLSLLGTFHGGDSSEKWDPKNSSMYQVLVSIQGLIMNSEPIYNEPGYTDLQGTPEGNDRSAEYNARLHPYTVRYAMLDQLRHPPQGFEDVVLEHFKCQKNVILKQCSKWLKESPTPQLKKKLQRAVAELQQELDKL